MDRLVWDENHLVGVASIDAQHRELAELVERLDQRIAARAGLAEIRDVFEELALQAQCHFRHEESFFAGKAYGRADKHKREHDRLLLILKRFCQSLDAKAIGADPVQHAAFLRSWLYAHIDSEDRLLGIHLNSLGIR